MTVLALVIISVAGCGSPTVDPAIIADTWVAQSVNGHLLPDRQPVTIGEWIYEADTLRLTADGRFTHRFTIVWVTASDETRRIYDLPGQYTLLGSRVTLFYDCVTEGSPGCEADTPQGTWRSEDRLVVGGPMSIEYRRAGN